MARIQIVPLPTIRDGELERTPFIIVMDQLDRDEESWTDETLDVLKATTGAALVLAHEATIDAPGALDLTDEQKSELLAYLTEPRRVTLAPDIEANFETEPAPITSLPSHTRCGQIDEHSAHFGYLLTPGAEDGTQTRIVCDGRGRQATR
jgi:hypothetical protein